MKVDEFDSKLSYCTKQLAVIRETKKLARFAHSKAVYRGQLESPERLDEAEARTIQVNDLLRDILKEVGELYNKNSWDLANITTMRNGGVK